jgi:hypothetical protein
LKPNDVIENYKEVKEQVDAMDEEEISVLAEQVAALASAIDDPDDRVARNVVSFFEQEKISPEARHSGIRVLTKNMTGKLVSEKLAILLAADIDKLPQSFWGEEDDSFIMKIDMINDVDKLEQLINRTDVSNRVRRAAAMKAYRLAESIEDKTRFAMLKDKYSDGGESNDTE